MKKPEHYYMCLECAKNMGAEFQQDHICTVTTDKCPYCGAKDVTLIPWVDFDWPQDQDTDKIAKGNRD